MKPSTAQIQVKGLAEMFVTVALTAAKKMGVVSNSLHPDSSSVQNIREFEEHTHCSSMGLFICCLFLDKSTVSGNKLIGDRR